MKKPFPYFRCIDYADDGCSAYECLACKAKWEARYMPTNYCGGCGVKFIGEHKPNERTKYPSHIVQKTRWVIEARRVTAYKSHRIDWTVVLDNRINTAAAALYWIKRYRANEEWDQYKYKHDWPEGFGIASRLEFRAKLTDREVDFNLYNSWCGCPHDEKDLALYKQIWHEEKVEEAKNGTA